jgi:hypothetical protein
MRLPPFTLVQSSRKKLSSSASGELKGISTFKKGLQDTLAASLASGVLTSSDVATVAKVLNETSKSKTVGIWDIRSWVGGLPRIVEHLNRAQSELTFFEVQASVPSGLVQNAERVAHRATEILGRDLSPSEREEMRDAIVDVDFFPVGHRVRKDLGIDYMIVLTSAPIAGEVTDEAGRTFHCDFFSSPQNHVCLASTAGLREFAEAAARPFEMAAGYVAVSSLIADMNAGVGFHDESNGCLFDYNDDNRGIVAGLKKPSIEAACLAKIRQGNRETALKLVQALDDYRSPTESTVVSDKPSPGATRKRAAQRQAER